MGLCLTSTGKMANHTRTSQTKEFRPKVSQTKTLSSLLFRAPFFEKLLHVVERLLLLPQRLLLEIGELHTQRVNLPATFVHGVLVRFHLSSVSIRCVVIVDVTRS